MRKDVIFRLVLFIKKKNRITQYDFKFTLWKPRANDQGTATKRKKKKTTQFAETRQDIHKILTEESSSSAKEQSGPSNNNKHIIFPGK